jgi:uncharacterized protein (TIGR03435 family)
LSATEGGRTTILKVKQIFVALLAAALAAQPPTAAPAVPPNAPSIPREISFTPILPGGQFIDSRATLWDVIAIAYHVNFAATHILGLPNWAKNQSYSVAAKPPEGFSALSPAQNTEQVRLMLRAMLAARFHLQIHSETRREPVFHLEVAKGGVRIKEVDPPVPPQNDGCHEEAANCFPASSPSMAPSGRGSFATQCRRTRGSWSAYEIYNAGASSGGRFKQP